MLKQYIPVALMGFLVITNSACNAQNGGYKKTASGLEYKIVKDAPGTKKAAVGDIMTFHLKLHIGDSVLFSTREMNKNEPVPYQLPQPAFKGDVSEGFQMLTVGDSASFRISADSVMAKGQQLPPWVTKGKGMKIQWDVKVVKVQTQAEMQAEQTAKAAEQVGIDDKKLQDYFAANNIKPMKTASGLYYKIDKPGAGATPKPGQQVTMNYTGKTLAGTVFDSNVDPKFQHVQPFTFAIGQHQVITGWDEGVALMNKGTKGWLYIPSTMAYGAQAKGGDIGANEILIFEVEVVDIADNAPAPQEAPMHK